MKLRNLCISCGGTGGHFYPGLAVAREWKRQNGNVLLILGGKHAEKQAQTAASFGIDSVQISARGLSLHPVRLAGFFFALLRGILQSRRAFRDFQADALLCMGSFASVPPILAAKLFHVPFFLHDGNARLGKTTLQFSSSAKALALSFPTPDGKKCTCIQELTGMPLRRELVEDIPEKEKALCVINEKWNCHFSPERKTLLIFGGSLGAASINDHCRISADVPEKEAIQLIHLTGSGNLSALQEYYKDASFPVLLLESSPEMQLFYAAADLIVCRAGGSTVSEVACFGKYAFLIPYPFATGDHQSDNARYLTDGGGAELIPDHTLTLSLFTEKVLSFLQQEEEYVEKGLLNKTRSFPDAAQRVLALIQSNL